MQIPIDKKIKIKDRIYAAFIFFTRLPFWRIYQPTREAYETVVEHWPLVGWLTGIAMAGTLYLCHLILPLSLSILLAMLVRILLTGALHEDGLADFCDGFGGGTSREKILSIMKDSHIGTYGVIGLILYELIFFQTISTICSITEMKTCIFAIIGGDAFSKMIAAQIIQFLPYTRNAETAKNGVVYRKLSLKSGISLFLQGVLPMIPLLYSTGFAHINWIIFAPCITMFLLYTLMNKKIGGYTGDCCGAIFLLCELTFYIAFAGTIYYNIVTI